MPSREIVTTIPVITTPGADGTSSDRCLEFCGINPDRIQFSWISAAEGGKWVETINGIVDAVREHWVRLNRIRSLIQSAPGGATDASGETG